MKRPLIRLALLLLIGAVVCAVAYRLIGVRVEADGTLREAFPLIPIGYLLGRRRRRDRDRRPVVEGASEAPGRLRTEPLPNAAPEGQARTIERKQEIGGGLSTRWGCNPIFLHILRASYSLISL
jgi:hypothetical protein